ncbi:MAG: hypothetical protein SO389_01735 [Eubacterium sp.]|nr:hypothetical protein [Eubacterium sp.]
MSPDLKKKLSSRKLWAAVAAFACSLAVAFGCSESSAAQISAVITAGGVAAAYIFGESYIDSKK